MAATNNQNIFNKISTLKGTKLVIELNENFEQSLETFRNITSQTNTYSGEPYREVYLTDNDYGGLTVQYGDNKSLKLLVNLEFYYVYGFMIGNKVYGFGGTRNGGQGEGYDGLTKLGFDVTRIPYGDAYYEISAGLTKEQFLDLKKETPSLDTITKNLDLINDDKIGFEDKNKAILITLWSLIEGVRFSTISGTVKQLIEGKSTDRIFNDFFNLAEVWARFSVAAAKYGVYNPSIAVYELHKLHKKVNSTTGLEELYVDPTEFIKDSTF